MVIEAWECMKCGRQVDERELTTSNVYGASVMRAWCEGCQNTSDYKRVLARVDSRQEVATIVYNVVLDKIKPGYIKSDGFTIEGDRHDLAFAIADKLLEGGKICQKRTEDHTFSPERDAVTLARLFIDWVRAQLDAYEDAELK